MDGKVFSVDELQVGVTAPPFHPNCGCTIVPYVESEEGLQDEEEEEQEPAPTKDQIIYDNRALELEEMQIKSIMNSACWKLKYYIGDNYADFGLIQWTPSTCNILV